LAKDSVGMACMILSDDETPGLISQQLFTAIKSCRWPSGYYAMKANLDREIAEKNRRIRREELHGFNIYLYGLAFE
jgi:hypothetical protein